MNQDFEKKLKAVIDAAGKIKPGQAMHINVLHDAGCRALKTKRLSDCTCKPIIKKLTEC